MKTVLDTLTSGADYLGKHGVESPRLNMEHLVAHVLGCTRMQLYLDFDRPLTEQQLAPLRDLLKRRGRREPLQHLLGTIEFHGREFKTDSRALIPRPETETLIERLLQRATAPGGSIPKHILDMGTGSGVIGLTLAAEWAEHGVHVTLADVSTEALTLARENAVALGLTDPEQTPVPVTFIESDLWQNIDPAAKFDLLVANLPYVSETDLAKAEPELSHDPRLALVGGQDGTDVIQRFLTDASAHATPGALLALEIAMDQADQVIALAQQHGWTDVVAENDLDNRPRYVFGRLGGTL